MGSNIQKIDEGKVAYVKLRTSTETAHYLMAVERQTDEEIVAKEFHPLLGRGSRELVYDQVLGVDMPGKRPGPRRINLEAVEKYADVLVTGDVSRAREELAKDGMEVFGEVVKHYLS